MGETLKILSLNRDQSRGRNLNCILKSSFLTPAEKHEDTGIHKMNSLPNKSTAYLKNLKAKTEAKS